MWPTSNACETRRGRNTPESRSIHKRGVGDLETFLAPWNMRLQDTYHVTWELPLYPNMQIANIQFHMQWSLNPKPTTPPYHPFHKHIKLNLKMIQVLYFHLFGSQKHSRTLFLWCSLNLNLSIANLESLDLVGHFNFGMLFSFLNIHPSNVFTKSNRIPSQSPDEQTKLISFYFKRKGIHSLEL